MRSWAFLASALATSLAWAIYSFTLMMVFINPLWVRASIGAVTGLLFGAFASAGQYALLFERLLRPGKWIVLTTLGWTCAGILVALVSALRVPPDLGAQYAVGLALGGIIVGLLQWLALKRLSVRLHTFLPATAAVWALAGFISWQLYERLYLSDALMLFPGSRPTDTDIGFAKEVLSGLLGASISGLLMGVLTSCVLFFTARARNPSPSV
ncbi:MAG: hypothetical protein WCD37_07290 [Chloroflexia bacterium]